jgi:hypothetical protein
LVSNGIYFSAKLVSKWYLIDTKLALDTWWEPWDTQRESLFLPVIFFVKARKGLCGHNIYDLDCLNVFLILLLRLALFLSFCIINKIIKSAYPPKGQQWSTMVDAEEWSHCDCLLHHYCTTCWLSVCILSSSVISIFHRFVHPSTRNLTMLTLVLVKCVLWLVRIAFFSQTWQHANRLCFPPEMSCGSRQKLVIVRLRIYHILLRIILQLRNSL